MRHDKARHQKSIDQIALPLEDRGEASGAKRSDEAMSAEQGDDRSGLDTLTLMDRVVEGGNLRRALHRVQRNEGSPGVDGLTVEELPDYLREHWSAMRERLLTGRYQPSVVKRVEIPKSGGGMRQLGIPTVLDRFIQQALLQILQPAIDPTFSESSYGFRPGRSAHDAVCQAQRYVPSGRRWVVDVDLEKFFDRVNHDVLMGLMAKRIADPRVLRLIRRYLEAGMLANGVMVDRHEGTPQGGPLSPLLANVLLDVVDKQLEQRGHRFVRYADDCNVYVQSKRAAERVMAGLIQLYAKLKLRVNPAKMRSYLVGWKAYFRLADTPGVFTDVDKWLHRRLRMLMLKQWKRGRTMYRELHRRGVGGVALGIAARYGRSWWHVAAHKALHIALPGKHFESLGLPRLGCS